MSTVRPTYSTPFPYTTLFRSMRTSLLDTLLEAAVRNVGRGSTDLAIYEIGSVTRPTGPLSSSPLPPPGRLPEPVDLEAVRAAVRSEEHTSELQSRENLVCRLL